MYTLVIIFWLCRVLTVACGAFCLRCSLRAQLWHAGSSSLTGDWTWAPCLEGRVLASGPESGSCAVNSWPFFFFFKLFPIVLQLFSNSSYFLYFPFILLCAESMFPFQSFYAHLSELFSLLISQILLADSWHCIACRFLRVYERLVTFRELISCWLFVNFAASQPLTIFSASSLDFGAQLRCDLSRFQPALELFWRI